MTAIFYDLEDQGNPINGRRIDGGSEVALVFETLGKRAPCMFQLDLEDGRKVHVGVATEVGCVQLTRSDGMPPYLMAVIDQPMPLDTMDMEFLVGGTPTPISSRYCMGLTIVQQVVEAVLDGRDLPTRTSWEEFDGSL